MAHKRTPDESADRIALFFENVAAAVRDSHGVFSSGDFNAGERRMILSALRNDARHFRRKANEHRTEAARTEGNN